MGNETIGNWKLEVLPVVECGGESVILCDHIRKHCDNPFF